MRRRATSRRRRGDTSLRRRKKKRQKGFRCRREFNTKDKRRRLILCEERVDEDVVKNVSERLVYYDLAQKKVICLVEEDVTRDPTQWDRAQKNVVLHRIATEVDTSSNPLLYINIPRQAEDDIFRLLKERFAMYRGNGKLGRAHTEFKKEHKHDPDAMWKPTEHDYWVLLNGNDRKSCLSAGLGKLYGLKELGEGSDVEGGDKKKEEPVALGLFVAHAHAGVVWLLCCVCLHTHTACAQAIPGTFREPVVSATTSARSCSSRRARRAKVSRTLRPGGRTRGARVC